ncbi:Polyketide synthase enoylreductase [Penicillium verhagenii]|uniref:Polyketide synthase enoylreductase n=1 Tax=Penicillium verhagenii TaxID=1562060 RepID=UPI0025452BD9|nr:Polyketide synthase enoylreductase [Penicillium verhagenii]KAJ5934153.1 Polyketide synthase enoylreductase [Penicillium verhagenii]
MTQNHAAWQLQCHTPLQIQPTPYPETLSETQVLIKVHAWAINPADYILQDTELAFVSYPVILGEDIAGTIVALGNATQFALNDRVIGFAQGATKGPAMGGFQEYVVIESELVCRIPDSMPFEEGVVLPLGFSTAAHALANEEYLGLEMPGSRTGTSISTAPGDQGKECVLIWGGSSSVGSNAIQLAVAMGLEVLTTASPRNFESLKELGANMVFDYTASDVVSLIATELNARSGCVSIIQAAGFAASLGPVLEIASLLKADVFVVTTTPLQEGVVPKGVRAKMLFGGNQDTILGLWREFLPNALKDGRYHAKPKPLVMETRGLQGIQEGYDVLRAGVSAKKVVVLA